MLTDGIQAIAYIKNPVSYRAHVMLLDIMMPGKTGLEVMEECRPPWPVIAMTGNVDEQSQLAYARLAFDAVLPKPFNADQLKTAMASGIASYKREASLAAW